MMMIVLKNGSSSFGPLFLFWARISSWKIKWNKDYLFKIQKINGVSFKNLPEIGLEVEEDEDDELREYKGGNDD